MSQKNFELEQVDRRNAFLNEDLDEETYLEATELPKQIRKKFDFSFWDGKYCRLLKRNYHLKQASRVFGINFRRIMEYIGFKKYAADP